MFTVFAMRRRDAIGKTTFLGNKQVNKNAAKDKSSDSSKHKRKAKARNDLGGGGQSRGRSKKQPK